MRTLDLQWRKPLSCSGNCLRQNTLLHVRVLNKYFRKYSECFQTVKSDGKISVLSSTDEDLGSGHLTSINTSTHFELIANIHGQDNNPLVYVYSLAHQKQNLLYFVPISSCKPADTLKPWWWTWLNNDVLALQLALSNTRYLTLFIQSYVIELLFLLQHSFMTLHGFACRHSHSV